MSNLRLFNATLFIISFSVWAFSPYAWGQSAPTDWPREISAPEASILIYQPQLETFAGNRLTARAAVSVTRAGDPTPVFGVFWVTAIVSTDREARTVALEELTVTDVKFPNATKQQIEKFRTIVEDHVPYGEFSMSLDRILAALDMVEMEQEASRDLKNAPPEIIFAETPTVLVVLDGAPQAQELEGTNIKRIVNTPFAMFQDPASQKYYLRGGDFWYSASSVEGDWTLEPSPPASIGALIEDDATPAPSEEAPAIRVETSPADLIVTDGPPGYAPLGGNDLLFVDNTDRDVLFEIDEQMYYVLLSGRWFSSASLKGPWIFVEPAELPGDFADIPASSAKGEVLSSVAGTDEAREAVMNAQIPQTSAVNRADVSLVVEYDGEPSFVQVEGRDFFYAENTSFAVFRVEGLFYVCYEAVWYEGPGPNGPWSIATYIPDAIYTVPPSCPHYSVKYVYIYDSTPDVVYVGYTPGYTGAYLYAGAVIYGTGWYYRPWHGHHYYPRPNTFGFAARYNPITDQWGFAVGHRGPNGWIAGGKGSWSGNWWGAGGGYWGGGGHWGGGGWWGAGGYRDIDIDINRNNFNNSNNLYSRERNRDRNPFDRGTNRVTSGDVRNRVGDRAGDRTAGQLRGGNERSRTLTESSNSIRDRANSRERTTGSSAQRRTSSVVTQKRNNVYADKSGKVFRDNNGTWQQRSSQGWTQPRTPQRSTRNQNTNRATSSFNASNLNRQSQTRQRGTYRTNSSRQSSGVSRSGSAGRTRGGGGRRR